MRVFVTGADGFVGAAVCHALAETGHTVIAASRRPAVFSSPNIRGATMPDLAAPVDTETWTSLLAHADAVVHCAGLAHQPAGTPASIVRRINYEATMEIAIAAQSVGVSRFVFLSSIRAQIGASAEEILTEDTFDLPDGAYGQSKHAAEVALAALAMPVVVLRPTLVHGPAVKGNLAQLLHLARLPLPLPIGNLAGRRSLVSVRNLASAISFALANTLPRGVYIVADDTPVTAGEIVSIWRRTMGRAPGIVTLPAPVWTIAERFIPARIVNRLGANLVASSAKLRAAGWQPITDTPQSLGEMVQAAAPRKFGTA